MKIINTKADIDSLPADEKSAWLARLAATIHQQQDDDSIITDISSIERFGYAIEDFPDAAITPYTAPPVTPVVIPQTIRAWQAKAILSIQGLLAPAEQVIATLDEPLRTIVTSAWVNNSDFSRTSTTITSLATALELTETQLDEMFIAASALSV